MRYYGKRMLSAALAIALLGSAVMLSVSAAKGPYRHAAENAFDGPPLGHPEKALITTAWVDDGEGEQPIAEEEAFDWRLDSAKACPNCGFRDSNVKPVVLDMPELLGGSDEAAMAVIKRKLGINPFRGSIFDDAEPAQTKLLKHEAPCELKSFDSVLEKLACDSPSNDQCPGRCSDTASCQVDHVRGRLCGESAYCNNGISAKTVDEWVSLPHDNVDDESDHRAGYATVRLRSEPVELLRMFSPGLDEVANKLEDADLYDEADAIREAAQMLRVKARLLKTGEATSMPRPSPFAGASLSKASCNCCKDQCGSDCKCGKAATEERIDSESP